MRKIFTFTFLLLSFTLLQAENITKQYHFSNPEVKVGDMYSSFHFEDTQVIGLIGEPALPYKMVSLLLPAGHKAVSVEISYSNEVVMPGTYTLSPKQPAHPVSDSEQYPFSINEALYASDLIYPAKANGELTTSYYSGYAIANCAVTPLRYNPFSKVVSYYSDITVTITTVPDEKAAQALSLLRSDKRVKATVNNMVQNHAMINAYPAKASKDDTYQNLIICPQNYADAFQELVSLYLKRGLKTQIATLEDIYSNMEGQDNQEKIRNYIIQEYTEKDITFALLGGDVELFPYRGFYCSVQSSSVYEDYNIPTDLYYSALDGTWDDNNNSVWGEIGEDDLLPEVSVARYSFSNAADLENLIHKTVEYQDNPVLGELKNPLLAGEDLYNDPQTWGADYLDLIIGHHEDNGYTTDGIPETDVITTMYDRDDPWSANELMAEINQGHSFIHHVGHSNSNYAMRMYNGDITDANFYNVNGVDHNYTLVYTHGCICGAFDDDDCIAERMVDIANFVVAGAYNSRYGWFNEGQTEGPSAHLHREFVDALYNDKQNRIGEAHLISRTETSPWVNAPGQHEEGALRWCFYDCNILGDPALAVWTDEPVTIAATYPTAIVIGETSIVVDLTVNGQAEEGYTCAIVADDMIYGAAETNADGTATINLDVLFIEPGEATLFVSGYNCIPQEYVISIVPGGECYVVLAETLLNDENGNGEPEVGEDLSITATLKNVGQQVAENVMASFTSADEFIIITDNQESYGSIGAEAQTTVENAFAFSVAENAPDQHIVHSEIAVTSGENNWIYDYNMTINAPSLISNGIVVDDADGNQNGRLDPGETVTLLYTIENSGHADCVAGNVTLSSFSNILSIVSGNAVFNAMAPNATEVCAFTVSVSDDAQAGQLVDLHFSAVAGAIEMQEDVSLLVGLIVEDFESGDFTAFDWQFSGSADWVLSETEPYEGTYSAASGTIGNSTSTSLEIAVEVSTADDISFFKKVSSESNYDFLEFYIDDTKKGSWSGDDDWSEVSYPVTVGSHIFKWTYLKDVYTTGGQDKSWIDYILFPPLTIETGILDEMTTNVSIYPNPASDRIFIDVPVGPEQVDLRLINSSGQLLKYISAQAGGTIMINISLLDKGLYFIQADDGERHTMGKFIKD